MLRKAVMQTCKVLTDDDDDDDQLAKFLRQRQRPEAEKRERLSGPNQKTQKGDTTFVLNDSSESDIWTNRYFNRHLI